LTVVPAASKATPDGPVNCSGGGTFTIENDVVVSSSDCVGDITIPAGVSVSSNAFNSNPNLQKIAFLGQIPLGAPWGAPSGVLVLRGISCSDSGYFVIWQTAVLGRHNCTGSVVIPEGITQIALSAFDADLGYGGLGRGDEGNYNDSSIATSITSLTIPSTVTSIGNYAFRSGNFSTLVIPNSVTSIGDAAFTGSSITSITIGNGLSTISPWSFAGLSFLTAVTFGTGVRTISERAFSDTPALLEVTIPDSVEVIGQAAFSEYYDSSPFVVRKQILNYCGNADLTDTGLPNPATNLATCAPASPLSLSATGGNGSVSIAFNVGAAGGTPITSYKYSLNGGPYTAFSSQSATSPQVISGLVNGTSYSVALKAVNSNGDGAASQPITAIAGSSAHSNPAIAGVTAPVAWVTPITSVTAANGYTGTVTWSDAPTTFNAATYYIATITLTPDPGYTLIGVPANFFTVADATSVTHTANSGIITAVFPATTGDGEIDCGGGGRYQFSSYEISGQTNCLGAVTVPNAITSIGEDAFRNVTGITSVTFASDSNLSSIGQNAFRLDLEISPGVAMPPGQLTSIEIPNSVESIGAGAFFQSDLSSITFEPLSSLESIGSQAFSKSLLTSIVIPASVESIGEQAFAENDSLTSVTFAPGIDLFELARMIFWRAGSLNSITIPESVESIGESAFAETGSLTSVFFSPNSNLRNIYDTAFSEATALGTIEIPATVEMIGAGAFYDATSLTSVTFAADSILMSLGDNAFRGASSLSVIDIPDNELEVGQYAFYGTAASLFSRSYVNWKSPLSTFSNGPKIGKKIFASAFEKGLSVLGLGPHIDEYVYRITMLENVATSSVDRQVSASYTPLDKDEQNEWYEDIGFDSNNPYQFSWHVFMCVGNANGTVSLTKPTNLSLSYASRDVVPTGSSSQNHWAAFRGASQALHLGSSPSTRTVVGKLYDVNTDAPQRGSDITDLDQANLPYSLGISEVHSSCGAGKTLQALQIVQPAEIGTSPIATKEFEITPVLRLIFEGEYFSQNSEGLTIGVTGGGGPPPFGGSYNAALWGLTTIASANPPSGGGGSSGGNATPVVSPNAPSVQPSSKTRSTIIAGFAGDSSKAPAALRQRISRVFSGFNQVATAECTGYTSGRAPSRWDTLLANRRAKVACDLVKQRHPSAKVKVIEKPAVGVGSKFRSVRIKIVGF
jgi:hypothetical protein